MGERNMMANALTGGLTPARKLLVNSLHQEYAHVLRPLAAEPR